MPRKKTEPTEEPKAAVSRRAASKKSEAAETAESAEETKESAVAAPEEAEKAVRKKRTYVRRKSLSLIHIFKYPTRCLTLFSKPTRWDAWPAKRWSPRG